MTQATMLPTVSDKASAVANVFSYNDALFSIDNLPQSVRDDLVRTLSMARSWFAVLRGGKWYYANAKYAGFHGMDPYFYSQNRIDFSGTEGETALKKLCGNIPVGKDHPAYKGLEEFLDQFGRKPNSLASVYILHEEDQADQNTTLPILVETAIEAVIALAVNLPPEGISALKKRVASLPEPINA